MPELRLLQKKPRLRLLEGLPEAVKPSPPEPTYEQTTLFRNVIKGYAKSLPYINAQLFPGSFEPTKKFAKTLEIAADRLTPRETSAIQTGTMLAVPGLRWLGAYNILKNAGISISKGEKYTLDSILTDRSYTEFPKMKGVLEKTGRTLAIDRIEMFKLNHPLISKTIGRKYLENLKDTILNAPPEVVASVTEVGVDIALLVGLHALSSGLDRASAIRRYNKIQQDLKVKRELMPSKARDILGVREGATPSELTMAYRNKSLSLHPDRPTGNEEAFKKLRASYEYLTGETPEFKLWAGVPGPTYKEITETLKGLKFNPAEIKQIASAIKTGAIESIPSAAVEALGKAGLLLEITKPPKEKPLIKGRIKQLESEIRNVDRQMRILEKEKSLLERKGIATGTVDKQLQDLSTKFNYLDSSIAELIIGQPRVAEIHRDTIQMKIGDILKEERKIVRRERVIGKEIGITKEKARIAEVKLRAKARESLRADIRDKVKDINAIDVTKMSPQEAEPIKKLIQNLDLVKRQKPTMLELTKTRQYLETNPDAEMPDYIMEKLSRLDKRNLNDITVDELDSVHKGIMHYAHLNRVKNQIKVGREIKRAHEVLNNSINEMKPAPKIKSDIITSQPTKIGKIKHTGQLIKDTFGIRHDHYDLITESLAGANSTMDRVLYQGPKEGINIQLRYRQNVFRQLQQDLNIKNFQQKYRIRDIGSWLNEKVKIGKFNLTRGERMALYRHSLNTNNLRHILEGGVGFRHSETPFKPQRITQGEMRAILNSLDGAEKEFSGQGISNLFDNQHRALNEVFYAKNGYILLKELNYYPIEVMKTALPKELEAESILEELKHKWVRIGLKKGMLENRIKSELPIYLNSIAYDINKSVMNSAAYIGLEEPLSNASKLLYNRKFRANIYNRYGPQTWHEIEKGLRDIAGDWQSYTTVEELLLTFKNRLTTAILGINPFVALKQILSYALYSVYVKPQYLLQGFMDHTTHPLEVMKRHKIYSPEYAERIEGGYSRDVADVFKTGAEKRVYKGRKGLKEKVMGGVKLLDMNAVNPGMQGAVLQVLDEFKIGRFSPEVQKALDIREIDITKLSAEDKLRLAYEFADYVTERTQPMFSPEHRSSLSRGSSVEKLATQFSSFTNQALNLIRRTWREGLRTKDPKIYAKLAKVLVLLLVVNTGGVMAIDNLRNWMFKRKYKKGYGEALLDSISSYFYFIRDVERSVVSKVKRGTFLGYDVSLPILSAANTMGDAISDGIGALLEKDPTKKKKRAGKFIDNSLATILMLNGIPYQTPKKIIMAPFKKKETKLRLLEGGKRTSKKLRLLY